MGAHPEKTMKQLETNKIKRRLKMFPVIEKPESEF
jgi:hypothetical protein